MSNLWIKETASTFVTLYVGAPTGVVRSWFLEYIPSCKLFSVYAVNCKFTTFLFTASCHFKWFMYPTIYSFSLCFDLQF